MKRLPSQRKARKTRGHTFQRRTIRDTIDGMLSPLSNKTNDKLKEIREREGEDLAQVLSARYGLEYTDLTMTAVNTDALRLVPEEAAREALIAPFKISGRKISVGVMGPENTKAKAVLSELIEKGYDISLYVVSERSLKKAWDLYKEATFAHETQAGVLDISREDIDALANELKEIGLIKKAVDKTLEEGKRYRISRVLEIIMAGGIGIGASDVHFETEGPDVRVRYRLDGVLQEGLRLTHDTYKFILSRIKLLSGLKLNVRDAAQDGRFAINLSFGELGIRTSTVPGEYGESIVLRLLNPQTAGVKIEDLGIEPALFTLVERAIKKPNGMILTTGPTGSGKTSTLYAFIKKIYDPEIKIITIEDPVEYRLLGVTQTQVEKDKGYTFAAGLRAAMRQDPDIIMVGEIRDDETALTAVNAALTGHLVFSTLHTNNAAGVIPRLFDLGSNPKTISSALTLSLAQRLLRKLCPSCKISYVPEGEDKRIVDSTLETIKAKRPLPLDISKNLYKAEVGKQCSICGGIGYKGRIGVFEGIVMDEKIEAIVTGGNPSEREIMHAAVGQNILSMREDGVLKALSGIVSLDELSRVVDLS